MKSAVITGAGSGVGCAMTQLFADQGAKVAAISRRSESLRQWVNVQNVVPIQADITRLEDIDRMIEEAERQFGEYLRVDAA